MPIKKKGLGKGLDSLIPDNKSIKSVTPDKSAEAKKEAEKKAAANEQVVKTATATTGEDKKSDTVKTGDPAQAGMLATTMLGGFAGIAASLKMKFRKKED